MDGAASVFAAVSIAIQLADSVKKLSEFWQSVKEAPQDVQNIITDLDLLTDALCEIALEAQQAEPDATLVTALRNCELNTTVLVKILNELQPGFASANSAVRKWTAIKSILKWEKIKKFQVTLDRLKSTLLIVRQNQISRSNRAQFQEQQRLFTAMGNNMSLLCERRAAVGFPIESNRTLIGQTSSADFPHESTSEVKTTPTCTENTRKLPVKDGSSTVSANNPDSQAKIIEGIEQPSPMSEHLTHSQKQQRLFGPRSWHKRRLYHDHFLKESIFGSVRVISSARSLKLATDDPQTKFIEGDQHREDEFLVRIEPAPWLRRLGIIYGLSLRLLDSSLYGWKHTLRSFRRVPDDAPIFKLCEDGDLPAVRQLLIDGEASVNDVNADGITPLHVAANSHDAELCSFLIMSGADRSAQTNSFPAFNFQQDGVFWSSEAFGSPFSFACGLNERCNDEQGDVTKTCDLLLDDFNFLDTEDDIWLFLMSILLQSTSETAIHWLISRVFPYVKANYTERQHVLLRLLIARRENMETMQLVLGSGPESSTEATNHYINTALAQAVRVGHSKYSVLLLDGADPNYSFLNLVSSQQESLTSMAMYSSFAFASCQTNLRKAGINIKSLVERELQATHITESGWTPTTLQRLFDWDFDIVDPWLLEPCSGCTEGGFLDGRAQPFWLRSLEEIKDGKHLEETEWHLHTKLNHETENEPESDIFCSFAAPEPIPDSLLSAEDNTNPHLDPPESQGNVKEESSRSSDSAVDRSSCPYEKDEMICMKCWFEYCRTGTRKKRPSIEETDDSSNEEFSPFYIHS